ncbi:MAG: HK97 gp10 family phage protein [Ruminococcus sp.]|nr:HK97 gp10 family phage protein [Ruminococcus sp.]
MSNIIISPEELSEAITEIVKFNLDENKKTLTNGIKTIAREAKQEVESKSRISKKEYGVNTGNSKHYKDSWTTTTTEEKGVLTVTVHNKKYQLVHLLENGHLLKDGTGRIYGEVPAFEHVESTNQNVEEKVNALLEGL